ncbi:hypothetical protein COO60DRAFT_1634486 [Scenedesmus sp. NREL 46B-D3]|nr:hypothetical protein COO60DRAFT_1634486 [Scenedesmus sp. NREL 46B-D3]
MAALLAQPAAVAALASMLAGFVKSWAVAQFRQQVQKLLAAPAAAAPPLALADAAAAAARSLPVLHDALQTAAAAVGKSPAELVAAGVAVQQREQGTGSAQRAVNLQAQREAQYQQPCSWQQYEGVHLQVGALLLRAFQAAVKQPTSQQQPALWPYLLQLHAAPQLVKAVEALGSSSSSGDQQQQVSALLSFCRVVTAAVPLPKVCNNPGCQHLGALSEAAAATKVCSSCGTRYCCRQCQEGDWKQHKAACKRLRG